VPWQGFCLYVLGYWLHVPAVACMSDRGGDNTTNTTVCALSEQHLRRRLGVPTGACESVLDVLLLLHGTRAWGSFRVCMYPACHPCVFLSAAASVHSCWFTRVEGLQRFRRGEAAPRRSITPSVATMPVVTRLFLLLLLCGTPGCSGPYRVLSLTHTTHTSSDTPLPICSSQSVFVWCAYEAHLLLRSTMLPACDPWSVAEMRQLPCCHRVCPFGRFSLLLQCYQCLGAFCCCGFGPEERARGLSVHGPEKVSCAGNSPYVGVAVVVACSNWGVCVCVRVHETAGVCVPSYSRIGQFCGRIPLWPLRVLPPTSTPLMPHMLAAHTPGLPRWLGASAAAGGSFPPCPSQLPPCLIFTALWVGPLCGCMSATEVLPACRMACALLFSR
jgi:hypothetical protein